MPLNGLQVLQELRPGYANVLIRKPRVLQLLQQSHPIAKAGINAVCHAAAHRLAFEAIDNRLNGVGLILLFLKLEFH